MVGSSHRKISVVVADSGFGTRRSNGADIETEAGVTMKLALDWGE